MILRLTAKLGKKIGVKPEQSLSPDMNLYLDWACHLFTALRNQYIIISNTTSLYSFIMPGRGITNDSRFSAHLISNMREFMCRDGHEFIFRRHIEPNTGIIQYSKINDKRVLGSIV